MNLCLTRERSQFSGESGNLPVFAATSRHLYSYTETVYFMSRSEMKWDRHYPVSVQNTVEALVSGHHRDAKKVSITKAGRLRECENTEFV